MRLFLSKKTKMIQGQSGYVLGVNADKSINVFSQPLPSGGFSFDAKPASSIDLVHTGYNEIVRFNHPGIGKVIELCSITISFSGFSSHFVVEYFDGVQLNTVREYWFNNQLPFCERMGVPIPFPYAANSYLAVRAKMNGVSQTGKGYAILNGYY